MSNYFYNKIKSFLHSCIPLVTAIATSVAAFQIMISRQNEVARVSDKYNTDVRPARQNAMNVCRE